MEDKSLERSVASLICSEIKNLGKIDVIVSELLNHEVFNDLSKHNEKWQSEHEPEGDILHDVRFRLMHIQSKLEEIALLTENDNELGS